MIHLAAQLRVCDAAMQVLTDKADFAADDAKVQASCEFLDAVREWRARVAQRLASIDRAKGSTNHPAIPDRASLHLRERAAANFRSSTGLRRIKTGS
jgi:hypothetical protein